MARHAITVAKTPIATTMKKLARQPKPIWTSPPINGAIAGANDMIAPIRDNSRPACLPT